MACLKMPEVNHVLIAGNLTKDPVIRRTSNGIPVVNFCLASNRKYRDANNHWAEDVCYVGIVAWSRLAESCMEKLHKGSAVLVDGELQSRTWHGEDGTARTVVEVKAHRIQFLNKSDERPFDERFDSNSEEVGFDDEDYVPIPACVPASPSGQVVAVEISSVNHDLQELPGHQQPLAAGLGELPTPPIQLKLRPQLSSNGEEQV